MTPTTLATPLLHTLLNQPAERQRLISLYLREQMDDELLAAFETRLLEDRQLLDDVETQDLLRQTLRELPQQEVVGARPAPLRAPRWAIPLALAAGGLVGAVCMQWLAPPATFAVAGNVAVLQLPVSRGDEIPRASEFTLASGSGPLVLRVPATNEAGPFRIRVLTAKGVVLAEFSELAANDDGLLDVLLPPQAVGDTALILELAARKDGIWQARASRNITIRR